MSTVLQTMQTKVFQSEVRTLSDRLTEFIISTSQVDRDGDVINQRGWYLENFKKSPVVLWAHDYTIPPIGRAKSVWVDEKGLHATVEFPPEGIHALADQVSALVKAGFLNTTSVGLIVKKSSPSKTGHIIEEAELLEFSIVSVPANPGALVVNRTYDRAAMKGWLSESTPREGTIDWASVNREPEIDWKAINRSPADEVEVNVTTQDVERVVAAMAPAMRGALRSGLKAYAELGAKEAIRYMTGRLD